jgi:hypothetical protein
MEPKLLKMEDDLYYFQMVGNLVLANLVSFFLVWNLIIFKNGRQPQFSSRQARGAILYMQLYFNPFIWNMEDDLNFFQMAEGLMFFALKKTFFLWMEDNLQKYIRENSRQNKY